MDNNEPLDMLQIKIDRAKESLPEETLKAINSVDWRAVILGMREKKGYSYEQLEDLELETELLLCGLLNPVDYPKEIEERLKLPRSQVDLLVQEMNEMVFKKIKDELIKNSERKEIFVKKEEAGVKIPTQNTNQDFANMKMPSTSAPASNTSIPIKTIPATPTISEMPPSNLSPFKKEEAPSTTSGQAGGQAPTPQPIQSISSQKLSGSFQMPTTKTQYSLDNLSKTGKNGEVIPTTTDNAIKISKTDPYRVDPNE